jgi:hypothetical protein
MVMSIRYSLFVMRFIIYQRIACSIPTKIVTDNSYDNGIRKCTVIIENQDLQADRHFLTLSHPSRRKTVSKPALAITKIGIRTLSPIVPIDAI